MTLNKFLQKTDHNFEQFFTLITIRTKSDKFLDQFYKDLDEIGLILQLFFLKYKYLLKS